MRIFVDGRALEYTPRGITRYTLGLYSHLVHLAPSVKATILHRAPLTVSVPEGIRTLSPLPNLKQRLWRRTILPLTVAVYRPDFVHFPSNGRIPFGIKKSKTVLSLHDIIPLDIPDYFDSVEKRQRYWNNQQRDIERAGIVITGSRYSASRIAEEFDIQNKLFVAYYGIYWDVLAWNGETVAIPSEPYFLFYGGYERRKGVDTLVEWFSELVKDNRTRAKLVLAGKRNHISSEFRDAVNKGVEAGWLIEAGFVNDSTLRRLLQGATAFIYLSKFEGFGLPVLEAMSQQCPVITTSCTSIPEVGGDAAIYVSPNDRNAFFDAIHMLEFNNEERNRYAKMGTDQSSKFSGEESARSFLRILQSH